MQIPRLVFGKPVRFPFEIVSLAPASDAATPQWIVAEARVLAESALEWTHAPQGDDSRISLGGWHDRSDVVVAFPGGLRFLISSDQRTITYDAPPATRLDALAHTLINNVVPIALALTGELVLHASVVESEGSCIAFAGPSGAGKSTLAAYLSHVRGCGLLADDGALVGWREDVPSATPSHRGLRLWPDSFHQIFPTADPLDVMDSSEKCVVSIAEPEAPAETELARLFILVSSPDGAAPSIEVPSLKDAMLTLAESVFRGNLHSKELLAKEFRSIERLVSSGIVRVLRHSKRYDELGAIADMIKRDVADAP